MEGIEYAGNARAPGNPAALPDSAHVRDSKQDIVAGLQGGANDTSPSF